jgi:hypothetical protein
VRSVWYMAGVMQGYQATAGVSLLGLKCGTRAKYGHPCRGMLPLLPLMAAPSTCCCIM